MTQQQTKLDSFTRAYIETMLWSSCDNNDTALDRNYIQSDIADVAMSAIMADCAKFQEQAGELIASDECTRGSGEYTQWEQAGHDFWLTRNRHGAGFWDGDWPTNGDKLTELAHEFGEVNPYVGDDGEIYLA